MTRSLAGLAAALLAASLSGCFSAPWAAHRGHTQSLNQYFRGGGKVDAAFDEGGGVGWTLMHYAANGGQVEVAKMLLAKGADPNARTPHGMTPLHTAASGQSIEMTRFLLTNGGRPAVSSRDELGSTPLIIACAVTAEHTGWVSTGVGVALATVRAPEPSGEIIDALLSAGADIGARTNQGNTPLHVAACRGYVGTVRILLSRGADPAIRNDRGETPEMLAQRFEQEEVVKLLRPAPQK